MEKLLVFATLGQRAYGRWLFQRFLSRAIAVVGLIFIIAILVSALLLGLLFIFYMALVQQGIDPFMATLIISVTTLLIIVMLVILALTYLRHLRQLPQSLLKQSPITSRVSSVFDAFMDGLMEK